MEQRKKYKCVHCDYNTDLISSLKQHMCIHNRNFQHKCTKCNASFNTLSHVATHLVQMHGELYKCNKCDLSFYTKRALTQHKHAHRIVIII